MLGDFIGAILRNIRDRNAELRRDADGDVVGADAVPTNDLQRRPGADDRGRHLLEAREDALAVAHELDEFVLLPRRRVDQLGSDLGEYRGLDARVGPGVVGDQDPKHRDPKAPAAQAYEDRRKPHTKSVTELAYMNGRMFHRLPQPLRPLRDFVFDHTPFLQKVIGEKMPADILAQLAEIEEPQTEPAPHGS